MCEALLRFGDYTAKWLQVAEKSANILRSQGAVDSAPKERDNEAQVNGLGAKDPNRYLSR